MNHHQQNAPQNNYSIRNFIPLITILSLIITATVCKQLIMPPWNWHSLMLDFMGIFFVVFATFKIINLKNFAMAYAEYDLVAKRSHIYALLYPFIELTLGILYLGRWQLMATNSATIIIMLVSSLGVTYELLQRKQITCACLGEVYKIPMTYVTLLEDLLMAGMALTMIIAH